MFLSVVKTEFKRDLDNQDLDNQMKTFYLSPVFEFIAYTFPKSNVPRFKKREMGFS